MNKRLVQFLEYKGIKIATFEKIISVSNNTIRTAVNKNTTITSGVLEKILYSFPELNANWLITGKGSMLISAHEVPDKQAETQPDITVSIKIKPSDPLYEELIQRLKK